MDNRQQRRFAARQAAKSGKNGGPNPIGQLTKALDDLKMVQELGQAAKTVEALQEKLGRAETLVNELATMGEALEAALEKAEGFQGELDRQRAVFLRFLINDDTLLSPGPEMYAKFLATEQRYRAEYDAMRFLAWLVEWAKEAP